MKRLTLLLFLFTLTTGTTFAQNGIYLFGVLNDGPGEPVDMTATIFSDPSVEVEFSSNADGSIPIFWVPLPGPDWSHLTVDFSDCQGQFVTSYLMNDSLQPLVDVYLNLDYCTNDTIWGCTDVNALNYDPLANADDGSCLYTTVPNDHCADAIPLSPGTMIVDNTGATNTGDIWGACWGFGNGEAEQNSLWYSFTTPDVPASIHIGTYSDATFTLTDTQLGVFESCGGEMIYCDGNSGPNLFAALDFECGTLAVNSTYIVMIDGWNGDNGSCMLNFTVDTTCTEIPGCTDPNAVNYNPAANVDDGSCEYEEPCDGTEIYFSYAFTAISDTTQFASWVITNASGETVASGEDNWQQASYPFCLDDGCYTFTVNNVPANWEGYFSISGLGVDGSWVSVDGGSATYTIEFAINDPDCFGTTEIYGCTDPNAVNYDPTATADDGSCIYDSNCAEGELIFDYNVWADSALVYWGLNQMGGTYADSGYFDGFTYLYDVCLPDGCYELTLNNFGENSGGVVSLWIDDQIVFFEDHPGEDGSYTYTFGVNSEGCDEVVEEYGCTDPEASNYNPEATIDDGSCLYDWECTDTEVVLTYDLSLVTDSTFVDWFIVNAQGIAVANGADSSAQGSFTYCLSDGCYSLIVTNTQLDWAGIFQVTDGTNTSFLQVDNSSISYTLDFTVNIADCDTVVDVFGCTDPQALNYDASATIDDGSCVYDPGCTELDLIFDYFTWADSAIVQWTLEEIGGSYEANGYFDGFNYLYDVCVPDGCYTLTMDNFGDNSGGVLTVFDENLWLLSETHSGVDGIHTYTFGVNAEGCDETVEVPGCTDPLALNYDPEATVDDGSCSYFNTDCEISFQVVPDSSGENVIWIYTSFDPTTTISVLWDFGDGNTSTEWYPSHTYSDEGPYTLCVSVIIGEPASAECVASFCMEVDGGMIGSGLVSSGFSINIIDSSTLVSNSEAEKSFDLRLWPNPANERIQVQFTSEMGSSSELRIYDLTGKAVYFTNLGLSPGANTFKIDLIGLESGIYTMELMGAEGRWVEKFVVGR